MVQNQYFYCFNKLKYGFNFILLKQRLKRGNKLKYCTITSSKPAVEVKGMSTVFILAKPT